LETKFKSQPKIYRNIIVFAMRERPFVTEHVYRSNVRFWYQSQSFCQLEV